jgi:hypothetical protein
MKQPTHKIDGQESILTEFVRRDLNSLGYTTYAEVLDTSSTIRCDMYARIEDPNHTNYGHTIVFEAKLSFTLKVIEQAYKWLAKRRAHDVYIIVPSTFKNISTRKFARDVCSKLGIGVMEVNMVKNKYYVTVKPIRCDKPNPPKLYEQQKNTIASNASNAYVTPFKITLENIITYMEHKNHDFLTNMVKNIKHHYKGDISAVRSIRFLIDKNIIKDFYITKENNKLIIKKHGF